MNMHKLRRIQTMASSGLFVAIVASVVWLSTAHAQELAFAQRMVGTEAGDADSIQFRSTIIDPSRSGKAMNADTRALRVIPINNSTEVASSERNCSICGVVESISLTVRNNPPLKELDDENTMEGVDKPVNKARNNLLLTDERWVITPAGTNGLKKHAPFFEIKVRMTDGTVRIVNQPTQPDYTVGDYVRVISGALTAA